MNTSRTSTAALQPNGLVAPSDFPSAAYDKVHAHVAQKRPSHAYYEQFSGAWNAVAYRFCASVDYGSEFVVSLEAHGPAPDPLIRYQQERALFGLFSSGFSTFESGFYALFAIGAFIDPAHFPFSTPKDQQQVTPTRTRDAYAKAFAGDPILTTIAQLFGDSAYQRWREIRNILTHRSAPGRRLYVSVGSDDAIPTEWKLNNIPLDSTIATNNRQDLARMLAAFLSAIEQFAISKLN